MEWPKAKTIIILLLLAMNVFLFSRILMEYGGQGLSREAVANMAEILQSRGVEITCKVPLYDRDTPRLEFGNGVFNIPEQVKRLLGISVSSDVKYGGTDLVFESGSKKITFKGPNTFLYEDSSPGEQVDYGDLKEAEKYLVRFLKEKKLFTGNYTMDGPPVLYHEGAVFSFVEKYKGFLVFDNYIKAVVTAKGVTRLEVSHRNIIRFNPELIRDIHTAYQVMLENFDGSEKTVVMAIDLGYKDAGTEEQNGLKSSEQLPVWRIKVNGQYRYFGASEGKEIK